MIPVSKYTRRKLEADRNGRRHLRIDDRSGFPNHRGCQRRVNFISFWVRKLFLRIISFCLFFAKYFSRIFLMFFFFISSKIFLTNISHEYFFENISQLFLFLFLREYFSRIFQAFLFIYLFENISCSGVLGPAQAGAMDLVRLESVVG